MKIGAIIVFLASLLFASGALADSCVDCHKKITPRIVSDWKISKHGQVNFPCSTCHGEGHQSEADVANAKIPTADTCANCHRIVVAEFKSGKHALAWAAMKAMPTFHWQPMAMTEGMKGCGGCHKIGLKKESEIKELKKGGALFGAASCNACHTSHAFSVKEAQQPQSCQKCHNGFDHAQWEMYSGSKHGVRFLLKQNKTLPEDVAAPTCQTCHMQGGNHQVQTAWGFLAVRLPMPEDKQWASDRATILQALGVLDPAGKPTARMDFIKTANVARLTQEAWEKERNKMISTCTQCHSVNFVKQDLEKGDGMIREADRMMAKAIRVVADLYRDGILRKPKNYPFAFPDILAFHDAPTVIEQKLFVMFMEHRMRTFQGTFHANPDYALWYGWSGMRRDLTEIEEMAKAMRINNKKTKK